MQLVDLALPVFEGPLQRLFREHLRLLLDVFLLLREFFLADVELELPTLEELSQRRLGAETVFGLHGGALHIDDGDARRLAIGSLADRGEHRSSEADRGEGEDREARAKRVHGAHFFAGFLPLFGSVLGSGGSGGTPDSVL